jgi:uncharacterized protein
VEPEIGVSILSCRDSAFDPGVKSTAITRSPEAARRSRRGVLKAILGGALGLSSGGWTLGCEPRHRNVHRWGSSTLGSSGYVIMEAFVQAVNRRGGSRNASLATSGAAENLFLLANGKLEFGHTTSVDWTVAARGESPYRSPIVCQQLFAYATWHMPPVVRRDGGIETLEDLRGRRYAPSTPGSGAALMHHGLMKAAGLYDAVRWTYGSWNEIYDAFQTKRVDVVPGVITNGAVSARLIEAQASAEIVPLAIPADVIENARRLSPGIYWEEKTRDVWSAIEKPTILPYSIGILAAAPDTTPEVGYEVTRAVLDDSERIRKLGLALRNVELDFAVRALMTEFPVNRGALQYFRERGVPDATISGMRPASP